MLQAAAQMDRVDEWDMARRLAAWLSVAVIAYPLVVWPLLVGSPTSEFVDLLPPQGDSAPTALNRIYFVPLLVAALGMHLMQPAERRRGGGSLFTALTLLFLFWAGLSALWSYDPGVTLRRLFLELSVIGVPMLAAVGLRDPRDVFDRLFWLVAINLAICLPVVAVETPGPLGYQAYYPQKNYLGSVMAMTVLIALYQVIGGRGLMRLLGLATTVLAFGLLVLSRSKTSLGLALLIPVVATVLALGMRNLRISPAISVLAIGLTLFGIYKVGSESGVWDFGDVAEVLLGDRTLTERTKIWEFAARMIGERPMLGWGYMAFWEMGPASPAYREAPGFVAKMPHAHNGYVDMTLQTGYVGLGILVLFLLAAFDRTRIAIDRNLAAGIFVLGVALLTTLHNGLETSFFRGFDAVFALLIVVLCALAPWARRP